MDTKTKFTYSTPQLFLLVQYYFVRASLTILTNYYTHFKKIRVLFHLGNYFFALFSNNTLYFFSNSFNYTFIFNFNFFFIFSQKLVGHDIRERSEERGERRKYFFNFRGSYLEDHLAILLEFMFLFFRPYSKSN